MICNLFWGLLVAQGVLIATDVVLLCRTQKMPLFEIFSQPMPCQPCHIVGTRFKSLQHNQCNSGQHREHIQYILSTPRKHTEKTENAQKSLRNHSENTQKTLRAHSPHLRGVPSSAGRHLFRNKLPEKDPFNFSIFLMDADNIRQMTTFSVF